MQIDSGSTSGGLEVRRRRWASWLWVPALFVLVAVGLWWMGHPAALSTSDDTVTVTTKTGQQAYAGLAAGGTPRSIEITGVEFATASDSEGSLDTDGLEVRLWICRDGAISRTTQPERFCDDVLPARGNTVEIGGDDQLMLGVSSTTPVSLHLERVRLDYREGLQRATQDFGPELDVVVLP